MRHLRVVSDCVGFAVVDDSQIGIALRRLQGNSDWDVRFSEVYYVRMLVNKVPERGYRLCKPLFQAIDSIRRSHASLKLFSRPR